MLFFNMVWGYITSFTWNVGLALLLLVGFAAAVFTGFKLQKHFFAKSLPLYLFPAASALGWLYGELRFTGAIRLPYDSAGFLLDSNQVIGAMLTVVFAEVFIGVLAAVLLPAYVKRSGWK